MPPRPADKYASAAAFTDADTHLPMQAHTYPSGHTRGPLQTHLPRGRVPTPSLPHAQTRKPTRSIHRPALFTDPLCTHLPISSSNPLRNKVGAGASGHRNALERSARVTGGHCLLLHCLLQAGTACCVLQAGTVCCVLQAGTACRVLQAGTACRVLQAGTACCVLQAGTVCCVLQAGTVCCVLQAGTVCCVRRALSAASRVPRTPAGIGDERTCACM